MDGRSTDARNRAILAIRSWERDGLDVNSCDENQIACYMSLARTHRRIHGSFFVNFFRNQRQEMLVGASAEKTFWAVPKKNFPDWAGLGGLPPTLRRAELSPEERQEIRPALVQNQLSQDDYYLLDSVIERGDLGTGAYLLRFYGKHHYVATGATGSGSNAFPHEGGGSGGGGGSGDLPIVTLPKAAPPNMPQAAGMPAPPQAARKPARELKRADTDSSDDQPAKRSKRLIATLAKTRDNIQIAADEDLWTSESPLSTNNVQFLSRDLLDIMKDLADEDQKEASVLVIKVGNFLANLCLKKPMYTNLKPFVPVFKELRTLAGDASGPQTWTMLERLADTEVESQKLPSWDGMKVTVRQRVRESPLFNDFVDRRLKFEFDKAKGLPQSAAEKQQLLDNVIGALRSGDDMHAEATAAKVVTSQSLSEATKLDYVIKNPSAQPVLQEWAPNETIQCALLLLEELPDLMQLSKMTVATIDKARALIKEINHLSPNPMVQDAFQFLDAVAEPTVSEYSWAPDLKVAVVAARLDVQGQKDFQWEDLNEEERAVAWKAAKVCFSARSSRPQWMLKWKASRKPANGGGASGKDGGAQPAKPTAATGGGAGVEGDGTASVPPPKDGVVEPEGGGARAGGGGGAGG